MLLRKIFTVFPLLALQMGCGAFSDMFLATSSGETKVIHRGYLCRQSEIPEGQTYAEAFSIYDVWEEYSSPSGAFQSRDFRRREYFCATHTDKYGYANEVSGEAPDWQVVCSLVLFSPRRTLNFSFLVETLTVEVTETAPAATRLIPCEAFEDVVSTYH